MVGEEGPVKKKRRREDGRPLKSEPPLLPADEVDRLLVFGELTPAVDGEIQQIRYPSYRELGERFGVAHTLVATYSKRHNCLRRREEAIERVRAKTDKAMVEMRAKGLSLSREETVKIIDKFLMQFFEALDEGRVRCDNASDFNTMVRLKEFVSGGPDSRSEVQGGLTLHTLQARHRALVTAARAAPEIRGELTAKDGSRPPSAGALDAHQEVAGNFQRQRIPTKPGSDDDGEGDAAEVSDPEAEAGAATVAPQATVAPSSGEGAHEAPP